MAQVASLNTEGFFEHLWQDYIQMAPAAAQLQQVFLERGEQVVNDHVALRTFNLEPIQLTALEPHLLAMSYRRFAPYQFPEKKLQAWGYVPPHDTLPRIFLSELDCSAFSPDLQEILRQLCIQVEPDLQGVFPMLMEQFIKALSLPVLTEFLNQPMCIAQVEQEEHGSQFD